MAETEVTKTLLRVESVIGENTKQVMLREVLDIPDVKPPVQQVIDQIIVPEVTSTTVIAGKVIVEGVLNLKVIYEGKTPYQTVHVAEFTIPFKDFVEVAGAFPGATAFVDVIVEHISFDVPPAGDPIIAQIVLAIFVKVVEAVQVEVVTDVKGPPGLQVRKELLKTENVIGEGTRQVIIREELDIPETKPDVAQVLGEIATTRITNVTIIDGKMIVAGVIDLKVIYEGITPYQTVHTAHFTIPFKDFVPVPGARPGMRAIVSTAIEHISFQVPPEGDPITVQIVLGIFAKVVEELQLEVVVDVFGIEGLEVTKELIRTEAVVGENAEQVLATQTVQVPPQKPCVAQVVDFVATPKVTERIIIVDKVKVGGVVALKIVYEGDIPEQTVHVLETNVPFLGLVEVPGTRPGMRADVRVRVEHISADILSLIPSERCPRVRVQIVVGIFVKVVFAIQIEVVTDVKIPAPEGICIAVVLGDRVNVRTGPSTGFPVITQVNRGDRVLIIAFEGEWSKVQLPDGRIGFIFSRLVKCIEPPLG